jgi:hypothetical protein
MRIGTTMTAAHHGYVAAARKPAPQLSDDQIRRARETTVPSTIAPSSPVRRDATNLCAALINNFVQDMIATGPPPPYRPPMPAIVDAHRRGQMLNVLA